MVNHALLDSLLVSPGSSAEDMLVLTANRDFTTAVGIDYIETDDNVHTPFACGFVTELWGLIEDEMYSEPSGETWCMDKWWQEIE